MIHTPVLGIGQAFLAAIILPDGRELFIKTPPLIPPNARILFVCYSRSGAAHLVRVKDEENHGGD